MSRIELQMIRNETGVHSEVGSVSFVYLWAENQ